ncbi:hypothetical protein [Nostoc sp.]
MFGKSNLLLALATGSRTPGADGGNPLQPFPYGERASYGRR